MRSACQWLMVALLLAGCGGSSGGRASGTAAVDSTTARPAASAPGRMTAERARAFLTDHAEALVLDVRNPDEWNDQYGHIDGARLIPLHELPARVAEIEAWKDRPIMVVCQAGARSRDAAELLAGLGYRRVFNLEGGMIAWRETERP